MSESLSDLHLPVIPLSAFPALAGGVGFREAEGAAEAGRATLDLYPAIKPWLEAALAAILLVLTAPVVLVAALLVKLTSRGPALYTQTRLGQHGRPYRIYKLRTMYQDAEAATGAVWSSAGDPRVTPVGRVLRATHIDELPQLFNVLCGDMSLSGPRPERPEIVRYLETKLPHYTERLRVRPGITGLAQVQLPPDVDLEGVRKKLVCDLYYLEHFGASLDGRILICTGLYFLGAPLAFSRRLLRIPEPLRDAALTPPEGVRRSCSTP